MTKEQLNKIQELEKKYSSYIDNCPFCGAKSLSELFIFSEDLGRYSAAIECNLCGCSQEVLYGDLNEEFIQKVLERWNTRDIN